MLAELIAKNKAATAQTSGTVGARVSYVVVRENETPKQVATRLGQPGAWQDLIRLNKSLGVKAFARERGTGQLMYTFLSPAQGGRYKAGARLVVPPGWVQRGVGVGRPWSGQVGYGEACDIGADCAPGEDCSMATHTCGGGKKVPPKQTGDSCSYDAQCASGEGCYDGKCGAAYDPCADNEVYVDGVCKKLGEGMPGDDCKTDTDCLNGLGQCVNHVCQHWPNQGGCSGNGETCNAYSDCCPGSVCALGVCKQSTVSTKKIPKVVGQDCTAENPCAEGLECVNGKCEKLKEPEKKSETNWLLWGVLGAVGVAVVGGVLYASSDDEKKKISGPVHNPSLIVPGTRYKVVSLGHPHRIEGYFATGREAETAARKYRNRKNSPGAAVVREVYADGSWHQW